MLKRVSYISKFSRPLTRDEVSKLAADAAEKNQAIGVTGMLMSSGGIFYQVLEGPVDAVDDLFKKIAADSRHRDVLVLSTHEDVEDRQPSGFRIAPLGVGTEADTPPLQGQ